VGQGAEAYLLYKRKSRVEWEDQYYKEIIEKSEDENVTVTVRRGDIDSTETDIYIVAKGMTGSDDHEVAFEYTRTENPQPAVDNSRMAFIAMLTLAACLVFLILVRVSEVTARAYREAEIISHENLKYQKRLGIDFTKDREELVALARKTKWNFSNDFLTNRSLFRK
jgi:hypothetical protein